MRKIKLSFARVLWAALLLMAPSCKKYIQKCENWEFQDVCMPKSNTANCYEYVHRVSNICDEELVDAQQGRTSVIHEDDQVRIERHYVKRVN